MATRRIEKKTTSFASKDYGAVKISPSSTFKKPSAGSEVAHEIDAPAKSTRNLSRFKSKSTEYKK